MNRIHLIPQLSRWITAVGLLPFFLSGQSLPTRIAFGSCGHQDKDLSIFDTIVKHNPHAFIFLGDNIYGDTKNMHTLSKKYRKLGRNAHYQALKQQVPILATWDDHDYGEDDAGRHYPKKKASKKIMLRFFDEPKKSERWDHEGIYSSVMYTTDTFSIQIIFLDLRTFRDDLLPYNGSLNGNPKYTYTLDYSPHTTSDSTMLGEAQWKWLAGELTQPADLRIICSSTQFATAYNGYETWANFPHEQERMKNLIRSTKADGVVFISGDVHYGELSKQQINGNYPIYDLTCSGLTEKWAFACPNEYRLGNPVQENHFGIIELEWENKKPRIHFQIWDAKNTLRLNEPVYLEELHYFQEAGK